MRRMPVVAIAVAAALGVPPLAIAADDVLATVGTRTIKRAEVEEKVKPKLLEIENERYEALKEGLDEIVADELVKQEAQARGVTPEALEKAEVDDKVPAPTDPDVQKVYDDNKAQLGGQTLEQLKPRIIAYLKAQKEEERKQAFINELKKKHKTTVALRPPIVPVETAGRPSRGGGPTAPVTIIEFSDYQCPFCRRAEDSVEQVIKTYGDKVRLVYRDFPLPMHPHARPASEAAACANEQGKFWEYHAKLFHGDGLEPDKLKTYADQVGLDRKKFDECLEKKPYKDAIDKDFADGEKAGVNGTP